MINQLTADYKISYEVKQVGGYIVDPELIKEWSDRELVRGTERARKEYRQGKTVPISHLAKVLGTSKK
jgi:hypothetical protein